MSRYSLLVSLHVASVVVWMGSGATLGLVALYARRARDGVLLTQLGALAQWIGLRVFAPAALAAFGFGVAAAHEGHWPDLFWFHIGEAAFAISFLLSVAIRLPLLRRARRGRLDPARLAGYLLAVAVAETTILYLAVADMVAKPSGIGASAVRDGAWVLGAGLLVAVLIALRARSIRPAGAVSALRVPEDDESTSAGSRAA